MAREPRREASARTLNTKRLVAAAAVIVLLLTVAIALPVWWLAEGQSFRDSVMQQEMEGSVRTAYGFETILNTQIAAVVSGYDEPRIESFLRAAGEAVQKSLERPTRTDGLARAAAYLTDAPEDQLDDAISALRGLLWHDDYLQAVSPADFGVTEATHEGSGYSHYEASKREKNKAAVCVPNPLVELRRSQHGFEHDLPIKVKRDLVFCRLAELLLRSSLNDQPGFLTRYDLYQLYCIPASGVIRLLRPEHVPPKIPASLRLFSNATYFPETHKNGYRTSYPYYDVTGGGLVVTYSVFVEDAEAGVSGLICLDRQLSTLEDVWHDLNFGSAVPDIEKGTFDPTTNGSGIPSEIAPIREKVLSNSAHAGGVHAHWLSENDVVYTVPFGNGRFGYVRVHPGMQSYVVYGATAMLGLMGVVAFLLYAWHLRRSAIRARIAQDAISDNIHGGLVFVDKSGEVLIANKKARELLGGEVIGRRIHDFMSDATQSEYQDRSASEKESFEFPGEMTMKSGDTTSVILASAPAPYPQDKTARMVIFIPSADLEVTIASKFIRVLSHTLKTPSHGILLAADQMRRKIPQAKRDHYYSLIERQIDELSDIVDDFIRFSSLESGYVEPMPDRIDLARIARSVMKPLDERLARTETRLENKVPEKLPAFADEEMVRVIISNVLDNAAKYTETGFIRVSGRALDGEVELAIADTGIGVPEGEREQIFERFYRGTGPVRKKDGAGLGLHICKIYVELLDGSIRCQPFEWQEKSSNMGRVIGTGAEFIIRLPRNEPAAA